MSACLTSAPLCQVNPLAETKDGKLIAADAKLGFDDNAAFRQKELFALRDTTQEDPRCVPALHPCWCLLPSQSYPAQLLTAVFIVDLMQYMHS